MNGSSRAMVGDSFLNGEDHSELPERKQVSDPSPIFVAGFQTTESFTGGTTQKKIRACFYYRIILSVCLFHFQET